MAHHKIKDISTGFSWPVVEWEIKRKETNKDWIKSYFFFRPHNCRGLYPNPNDINIKQV